MRLSEKALSSPLVIQERAEPANLRQAYHSYEESLLPAQSFFAHTSTGRPVYEPSSCKQKSSRDSENERIRILHERQKEQILAEVRTEILLVEPVLCCCTVVTAQPDTVDMTVTYFTAHRRLGPKSDRIDDNYHPCAQRTLHPFCVVFHACRSRSTNFKPILTEQVYRN